MNRPSIAVFAILVFSYPCVAQEQWFAESETCALCHSASPNATAMWNATGDDVSPFGLWRATMMANSFRDPYWRAQVSKEVAANPEHRAKIEGLCLTCHGPAAHHQARLDGVESPGVIGSEHDAYAIDGVTCTVCHQANPDNLGKDESFSGNLDIRKDKRIYGPFEDPFFQPMRMHTGFVATHGAHIRDPGLCGSCHTLFTSHVEGADPYPEQTPFLEWRNSVFSTDAGRTEESRTCQECHMAEQAPTRIAHNPRGLDFNIPARSPYRAHAFVGGNAFMLDLLESNADELGVEATSEELARMARATRLQLSHRTATLKVTDARTEDGELSFGVRVTNLTGHKFPTGYPARRAWVHVSVRSGRDTVFESGAFDTEGRLYGIDEPRRLPHFTRIDSEDQVQVYEIVPADQHGEPTTYLTRMAKNVKDNRLLPRGYRHDGPHVESTAPVGVEDDADFVGGGDVVRYRVALPAEREGRVVVVAWLHYQSIPPAWVDPLREVDTDEARRFVEMYDAANHEPETVAVDVVAVD
ncbi:MAG: hypothetical protein KDB80_04345 [Planctomycetes bacterium]|nr:hypothetical protein [Planctomycetota bacterium]